MLFESKKWFRQQRTKLPVINPQYLMTKDEVQQNRKIESMFKKFDVDNSGKLDYNELQVLFAENRV